MTPRPDEVQQRLDRITHDLRELVGGLLATVVENGELRSRVIALEERVREQVAKARAYDELKQKLEDLGL